MSIPSSFKHSFSADSLNQLESKKLEQLSAKSQRIKILTSLIKWLHPFPFAQRLELKLNLKLEKRINRLNVQSLKMTSINSSLSNNSFSYPSLILTSLNQTIHLEPHPVHKDIKRGTAPKEGSKSQRSELEKVELQANLIKHKKLKKEGGTHKGYIVFKKDKPSVKYLIKLEYDEHARQLGICLPQSLNEKLGADFYRYLSCGEFQIPKTRLLGDKIASKIDPYYIPFGSQLPVIKNDRLVIVFDQEEVEVKGFIRLLLIAKFIGDWDVYFGGTGGSNAGYQKLSFWKKKTCLVIKIDPGESFSALFVKEFTRDSRIKNNRGKDLFYLDYASLIQIPSLKQEFIAALQDVVNLTDKEIDYLVFGDEKRRVIPSNSEIVSQYYQSDLNAYKTQLSYLLKDSRENIRNMYKDLL